MASSPWRRNEDHHTSPNDFARPEPSGPQRQRSTFRDVPYGLRRAREVSRSWHPWVHPNPSEENTVGVPHRQLRIPNGGPTSGALICPVNVEATLAPFGGSGSGWTQIESGREGGPVQSL